MFPTKPNTHKPAVKPPAKQSEKPTAVSSAKPSEKPAAKSEAGQSARPATRAAAPFARSAGQPGRPGTPSGGSAARPPAPPAAAPAPPVPPPAPRFTQPRVLWRTFLRRCDSAPAATDDTVYTGAGSSLYCLDTGGRTLWVTDTGNQQSSPVLDETRVYIGSDRGILYAMDRATGRIQWQFRAKNTILKAPDVGGRHVYAESTDGLVYGVDRATGVLRWRFERPDGSLGYGSPLYTRDGLYVCGETTLYCLDPESGREMWRDEIGGKSLATPAEGGRRVFVGGDETGLTAVGNDGRRLWRFTGRESADWFGAPLYHAGTVYVSTYKRYVYAVDAVSGKEKWNARVLGPALSRPTLDEARGVLYVSAETFRDNPTLWAVDLRTGKILWNYRAGSVLESPAVHGDHLYAGSISGHFYAFAL